MSNFLLTNGEICDTIDIARIEVFFCPNETKAKTDFKNPLRGQNGLFRQAVMRISPHMYFCNKLTRQKERDIMRSINIAITAACFSGNKGAAAMLQSSIKQLREKYGERLNVYLMSTYPNADKKLIAEMPEKYDFIKVVDASPEKLLFISFPLAILYSFLRFIPPLKKLLLKNKILNSYSKTDVVIDEAGISFVDSRGFVMNTYAFVCAAVPMLCGAPVVKYSQALGTFKNAWNRFLAKWILPKIKLICARGKITQDNLAKIGITKNVRLCADGAFSMPDSEYWAQKVDELCSSDDFYKGRVISVSISSVVQGKCDKMGRDYKGVMTQFIDWLNESGYNVLLIANAAREGSDKPRNNDLLICSEVYDAVRDKSRVRWYPREMSPEEIRELIARSDALVASRFHAMIGALEKSTPTLLIGWSHKYKEVLDMFGLGEYAVDFSALDLELLKSRFSSFIEERENIREKLESGLPSVMKSSQDNIRYISEVIDEAAQKPSKGEFEGGDVLSAEEIKQAEEAAAKKPSLKKRLLKALKISFGVLVAVFLVWYFWKNWDEFSEKIKNVNLKIFAFSMLFYFVYKFTLASLWHYITKINGCSIKYEKAVTSYLYSILGKYIPGKVFMLAARLTYYKEEDAPLAKVTVCFFIENVCTLLGAAMLFILSLFFFPNELLNQYKWATVLLIAAFFVCINPKIINFFLRIVGKIFKKNLEIPMKYSQMLKVVLLFIGNWLIVGFGFFILTKSICPTVEWNQMLYCAGIWGVSAIMGILAIFAPSGLGVREGIIMLGLGLIMSEGDAAVISVVSRLWQTIPELALVAIAFVYSRIRKMSTIKLRQNAVSEKD